MSVVAKHRLLTLSWMAASIVVLLAGVATVAQSNQTNGEDDGTPTPKKTIRQEFMRTKLTLSQDVLSGLVMNDFKVIEGSARRLNVLTLGDEWGFSNSQEYKRMSEDLRRISRQLTRAGTDKNIDAATLAYQRLTLNCVECHQALREGFKEP